MLCEKALECISENTGSGQPAHIIMAGDISWEQFNLPTKTLVNKNILQYSYHYNHKKKRIFLQKTLLKRTNFQLTLSQTQILDSSKLKQLADKFHVMSGASDKKIVL